jgi:transposase
MSIELEFLFEIYKCKLPKPFLIYCTANNIDSVNKIPKCVCGKPTTYDKAYPGNGFARYCGPECSRANKTIAKDKEILLKDYDWLYNHRITLKKSVETIADELGISPVPVRKYIKLHDLPKVRYNESDYKVKLILEDKSKIEEMYQGMDMRQIAEKLGTSLSTVQIFIKKHGIPAKDSNSYPRKFNKRSKAEQEVFEFIKEICPDATHSVRNLIKGELDIFIPSKNIAYEFNGLYYHSEIWKGKLDHYNKTKACLDKGIMLYHIWEDDWRYKQDIVKSMISNKLGKSSRKIFARNCVVNSVEYNDARKFLDENHIQGFSKAKYYNGLFFKNELVALMSFSKSRFNKKVDWELVRYSVKMNCNIVGGFSKLLSNFRKEHKGFIVSYADISYSNGNVYVKNGFLLEKINPPAYSYLVDNCYRRVNRTQFTKRVLKEFNKEMSEKDIMDTLGAIRIWNCGTYRFILK